jgi:glycosyltransferase involved in cell wall biosynthesis
MGAKPTTSVIVPVFNGAMLVGEAIGSILAQLDPADEVIVVDDASTDETPRTLAALAPRITVLQGRGEGPSAARNLGLAAARGDFIALLDHDDLWPPGRHQALLAALEADPGADAAAGRVRIRVDSGDCPAFYQQLDGAHWPGILMSCLYRRRLIEAMGPFDVTMRFGEDNDYYQRQIEAGMTVVHCDVDSLIYRRHGGNATNAAPRRAATLLQMLARKVARERARGRP